MARALKTWWPPTCSVEAKWADTDIDKNLRYLASRFPKVAAFQVSAIGTNDYVSAEGIRVCPALNWLSSLV